jgi:ribosome maturation factor RimP
MEPVGWVLRVTVETLDHASSVAATEPLPTESGSPSSLPAADSIDLGLLAEISRDLSSALDVADIIPHRYHLEVSSPGLERPLRSPRDYERAVGQLAKLRLVAPSSDGQRVLRGRILEMAGDTVSVEVDGKTVFTPLTNIERAHLIFELPAHPKRSHAKPGKQKRH